MPTFVTSLAAAARHGAYAIERVSPAVIQAVGTGVCAIVGQFPWGPTQSVQLPADVTSRLNMYGPRGFTLTGKSYLSLVGKAFPELYVVRVLGTTAAKASATLQTGAAADVITVEAKYKGANGNSINCTVSDASDGDSNHFNLTVSVSSSSGTTQDVFYNLNWSGTGDDSDPDLTGMLLVGSITKDGAGRPANGTTPMTTGSDGSVVASDYVGTAGSPDKGLSLLEDYPRIRHFCADDPGNTIRAAVNAGIVAHANLMTNRVGYLNGNSGVTTIANVGTDAANYQSEYIVYADPWPYMYDDTTGAEQLVPPAPYLMSLAAQLSPSTSIAWKSGEAKSRLQSIVRLETPRGNGCSVNTAAGVATIVAEPTGGFAVEAGVTTIAPAEPAKRNLTRTRMGVYIATSFVNSVRSLVDAPNVEVNQVSLVTAITTFMDTLVRNQFKDPNHLPHVRGYEILDLAAWNSDAEISAGNFYIPLNVQTSSGMEKIFLSIQFGETVSVTAS